MNLGFFLCITAIIIIVSKRKMKADRDKNGQA